MEKIENPPVANYLMGSMRFMGYSFADAVADVIDNSISADAGTIKVLFPTSAEQLYVGIIDNGNGMSDDELFQAMCYGSQANENVRSKNDLGRFGLGMKSASLSQCRKMTVVSKIGEDISAYRWDYDEVSKQSNEGRWFVLKLDEDEISQLPCVDDLYEFEHGTLVLWENFDVISKSSNGRVFEQLTQYRNNLLNHLSLIYHRFITEDNLKIYVNFAKIDALDPFLVSKSQAPWGTIRQPMKNSRGEDCIIEITPYNLPFITNMSDEEKKMIGGAERMSEMQGYYIYRGKRLIKYGTWFGIARHEISKYARIKVDIPNSLDDIWKVDVMKRSAAIPTDIKKQIEKVINEVMVKSERQTTFRGRKKTQPDEQNVYVWDRIESRNGFYSYKINRENFFLKSIINQIPTDKQYLVELMLKEIEQNIPIHQMHLDHDRNKIDMDANKAITDELYEQSVITIEWLHTVGTSYEDAVSKVLKCEQFRNNEKLKEMICKKYNVSVGSI